MSKKAHPAAGPRRVVACGLAAALAMAVPGVAQADYLWLQRDGAEARVYAGEVLKPQPALPALSEPKPVLPEGKTLPFETTADHYRFTPGGEGDVRFTATRAGSDGVLTYYQARFGRNETTAVNDLELVPTVPGGSSFQLIFKGRPVAVGQVHVDTSEGWRRVLKPGADGSVSFTPAFPGLYVLEVSARVDNASVTVDGKTYQDVRHTATLSFEVK